MTIGLGDTVKVVSVPSLKEGVVVGFIPKDGDEAKLICASFDGKPHIRFWEEELIVVRAAPTKVKRAPKEKKKKAAPDEEVSPAPPTFFPPAPELAVYFPETFPTLPPAAPPKPKKPRALRPKKEVPVVTINHLPAPPVVTPPPPQPHRTPNARLPRSSKRPMW